MHFKFLLLTFVFIFFSGNAVVFADKLMLSPKPYIDFLNYQSGKKFKAFRQAGVTVGASNKYLLKPGAHRIKVKGREPGTILKELRIVPVAGTSSEIKKEVINIGAESGRFEAPMKPEKKDGSSVVVSGDNQGSAEYSFNINKAGEYYIDGKGWGPGSSSNSFAVSVDGGTEFIWDVPVRRKDPDIWIPLKARDLRYYASWSFPLTWGATSTKSKYYDDRNLRSLALAVSEAAIAKLAHRRVRPAQLWFLQELELVRMWQTDSRTPKTTVDRLLKAMRPYIDACYDMVIEHEGWKDNTPNIQLQSAAILRLAAEIWQDREPKTAAKWAKTARECVDRAWKWKLPDGPFSYSYGSGVDAGYFSFDGKNLTSYYQVTKDPRVAKALKDLMVFSESCSRYGQPISLGSPWWKHCYSDYDRSKSRGVKLSTLPLWLNRNPQYAKMVQLDLKRGLRKPYPESCDWLIAYYNSLQPEFECQTAELPDKTFFSKVDNGPSMRSGPFNISMPWRSWCESTCGAFYSTPDAVVSQICSTILTAVSADTKGKRAKSRYPVAYSIVEMSKPVPDRRACIIDKDFIVSATVFRPALGGPALPRFVNLKNDSPWQRCDIYFADRNGYAGSLELKALRDNNCTKVALWTRCSVKNLKIRDNKILVPELSLELEKRFSGKIVNLGKVWGPPHSFYPLDLLECVVKQSGPSGFKKGDSFRTKVSLKTGSNGTLSIGSYKYSDGIASIDILLDGKFHAKILFNRTNRNMKYKTESQYNLIVQSNDISGKYRKLKTSKVISLPPSSITMCK